MTSKSSIPPSFKNSSFDGDWSSHPAISWLIDHKKLFIWLFLALIALLILISRLFMIKTLNAEQDFFQAQKDFTQFQQIAATSAQDNSTSTADLQQLETIMQRRSELKPKYEGALAQTLLIEGDADQAQPFIKDIFQRTKQDHLKFYQHYTKTSLLITQQQFLEALKEAESLKLVLDQNSSTPFPLLYFFNLMRMAILYQQTDNSQLELKTWQEVQNQPQHLMTLLETNQILKTGHASLKQYIEERKHVLAN